MCVNNNDINERCVATSEDTDAPQPPLTAMVDGSTGPLLSQNAAFLFKKKCWRSQYSPKPVILQCVNSVLVHVYRDLISGNPKKSKENADFGIKRIEYVNWRPIKGCERSFKTQRSQRSKPVVWPSTSTFMVISCIGIVAMADGRRSSCFEWVSH